MYLFINYRLGEKGEGLKKYRLAVRTSPGDVKHSLGNIISPIVITMYGARRMLEISGGTLCEVSDCLTTMLHTRKLKQNNTEYKL